MDSRRLPRRRARLFAENPYCCYCGRELVLYKPEPGETLPGNFATIEHVNPRLGGQPRPQDGKTALACKKCNNEKGMQDKRAYRMNLPYDVSPRGLLTARIGELAPELKEIR